MRIKLKFYSEGPLVIPVQYNHAVQSLIYNNISEELAEFLHEWGFVLNGQRFKLFTFFHRIFKQMAKYFSNLVLLKNNITKHKQQFTFHLSGSIISLIST